MQVGDICTRSVVTCRRDASALEIAQLMRDRHVGDVIVVEEKQGRMTPLGIVTDRDLVVLVMAKGVLPKSLRAGDMLKGDLVTALQSEDIYDAIWHMRGQAIRRLPVVDSHNTLVGVVTADDLTRCLAEGLGAIGQIPSIQAKAEEAVLGPTES